MFRRYVNKAYVGALNAGLIVTECLVAKRRCRPIEEARIRANLAFYLAR